MRGQGTIGSYNYGDAISFERMAGVALCLLVIMGTQVAASSPNPRQFGPSSRHTPLTISEIHYHPADRDDGLDLSFVEIYNSEPVSHDIGGYRIAGDIDYTFPADTVLPARTHIAIAADPAAITSVYAVVDILGPYSNVLSRSSGTVKLRNAQDALLQQVSYEDQMPWPIEADGAGHSLVLAKPDYGENDVRAWEKSELINGSPGYALAEQSDPLDQLQINEFLAHTDLPQIDFIEIYNHGSASVDTTGCILTDTPNTNKYVITNGVLAANGFLAFDQTELGFSLSKNGDRIFLIRPDGMRVLDAVGFQAQSNGVSVGRYPDGAPTFHPLVASTKGAPNTGTDMRVDDVVINELMYHPISGRDDDEYIELYNKGTAPVDLSHWRFTDGIRYSFPAGTALAPGGMLVIAHDAEALRRKYPQLNSANTLGNYSGSLSDSGERVVLSRPEDTNELPWAFIEVDEVTYSDGWGEWTDGDGSSLELIDPRADNRLAANWGESDDTDKAEWTEIDYTDKVAFGTGGTSPFQMLALHPGEYIVDDLLATSGDVTCLSDDFESGLSGWSFLGSHRHGSVDPNGGFNGSAGLRIRATERGEFSGQDSRFDSNHAMKSFSTAPLTTWDMRLRAKVRWQHGFPYFIMGCRGYWFATPGELSVPDNLGSPGLPNSQTGNVGPAISDVSHAPLLPAVGTPVTVTCRVDDPDGISAVQLRYRVDPSTSVTVLTMRDDGTNGDAVPGDGIYTAIIPGQAANVTVAFTVTATDAAATPVQSGFPTRVFPDAPAAECLVAWGLPQPTATGIQTYRLLMTQANQSRLTSYGTYSKELIDATFLYHDARAVYNVGTRYRAGIGMSGYVTRMQGNDRLLGTKKFNLVSGIIERILYLPWMVRGIGEPSPAIRPTRVALHTGGLSLMTDYLTPSTELCENWYDDPDPAVYKNQHWVGDPFNIYSNEFGMNKAIYAGYNPKRAVKHPNDSFDPVYKIARAAATANNANYIQRLAAVVDIRSWASYMALSGLLADTDKYGFSYAHNYYVYIPRHERSRLFVHDMDFLFRNGAGTVRWPTGHPIPKKMFVDTPTFKRTYWAVLKDAADGPMQATPTARFYDEWADAYAAIGITPPGTATYKAIVATSVNAISNGLAAIAAPLAITTGGGLDFSTASNPVLLAGTVPVHAEQLLINDQPHKWTITGLTTWSAKVWLQPGVNTLALRALDHGMTDVSPAPVTIAITYTGLDTSLEGKLVINELMYHSPEPYGDFIELYNLSNETLPLGGLRLNGVDFTFMQGTFIEPNGYSVIAENIPGYQDTYGNVEVVDGQYNGSLDNGGETLSLLMPAGSNAWLTLDTVTYDDDPPWPNYPYQGGPDGGEPSIQVIDPLQDNNHPGNWAAIDITPTPAWRYMCVTGLSLRLHPTLMRKAALYAYLDAPGDVVIDDIGLATGTVAVADGGDNILVNGGFELSMTNGWLASGNHSGSTDATPWPHSDTGSVSVIATGPGDATTNALIQNRSLEFLRQVPLILDYWFFDNTNEANLTVEMSYTAGLSVSHSITTLPRPNVPATTTPGAANTTQDTLPPFPDLWINEVMPSNTTTSADNFGEFDPWIEIYNADSNAIDLTDYRLSNDALDLDQWAFPTGLTVSVDDHLLVWADGETNQTATGYVHAGFAMNSQAGSVYLSRALSNRTIIIDSLAYSTIQADSSIGRYPDGDPNVYQVFDTPTPSAPNNPTSEVVSIRINEWMPDNDAFMYDPIDSDAEDWFELYNPGNTTVDLGHMYLTDDLSVTNMFEVPGAVTIPPQGFLLVWADNEPGQNTPGGQLHVNFSLSKNGDSIALYGRDGQLLDAVQFGPIVTDQSEGAWPDGATQIYPMSPATPGTTNRVFIIRGVSSETSPDGFQVNWLANLGGLYSIEAAPHLPATNWVPITVVTVNTVNGEFLDTNAAAFPTRFYRITNLTP